MAGVSGVSEDAGPEMANPGGGGAGGSVGDNKILKKKGGEKMSTIDKDTCRMLIISGKWTKDCCLICRNRKRKCGQRDEQILLSKKVRA